MSEWYYAGADRQQHGPVSAQEIGQRLRQGELSQSMLVWRDGMPNWAPLREYIDEFAPELSDGVAGDVAVDAVPEAAAASGTVRDAWELEPLSPSVVVEEPAESGASAAYSPYAAPSAPLAVSATVVQGGEVVYAGFWKRVAAYLVDGFVIGMVSNIISVVIVILMMVLFAGEEIAALIAQIIAQLIGLIVTVAYYAGFHASERQATLGKMLVGIKVTRTDGHRITFLRGVGRMFAMMLSFMTLGVGFVMAAFTERKQCLHDMICDTLVVDKWAFTEHPEWQRHELGVATIVILVVWGVLILVMILALIFVGAMLGLAANR